MVDFLCDDVAGLVVVYWEMSSVSIHLEDDSNAPCAFCLPSKSWQASTNKNGTNTHDDEFNDAPFII